MGTVSPICLQSTPLPLQIPSQYLFVVLDFAFLTQPLFVKKQNKSNFFPLVTNLFSIFLLHQPAQYLTIYAVLNIYHCTAPDTIRYCGVGGEPGPSLLMSL